jgi:hypothetical protein
MTVPKMTGLAAKPYEGMGGLFGLEPVTIHLPERQVWLRSSRVSYSTTLPQEQCGEKGEILNRPDLAGFTWEPWPTAPEPNRSR